MALRQVLADAAAWIEHQAYVPDEIAVRFHHTLVQIHPFPNGNGRHSRLMADLLVMQLGRERFTWGSTSLQDADDVRRRYISALEAAKRFYVHHDCAASPVDPMTMTITLADVEKAMGIADRVAILNVAHRRNG